MTVENNIWRKLQMEAILSQHYQVENLQIYQNKGRIMNLDPTEITSPNFR